MGWSDAAGAPGVHSAEVRRVARPLSTHIWLMRYLHKQLAADLAGWTTRWAPARACVALFTAAIGWVRRLGHW